MNDPQIDAIYVTQFVFAGIHLLYFMIYYGRYSTLNQKLTGISKLEKAAIIEQAVIDASRVSIHAKIAKWRKWSYLPIPIIAVVHFFVLRAMIPVKQYLLELGIESYPNEEHYFNFAYISIGSLALIAAGNYVKGAQIFDPNKRFRGMGRPW